MFTDRLFTGQRHMTGIGLYFYNARFYSATLGRFISADTVVSNPFNPQNLNRFSYVMNNPVRFTDPSGRVCVEYGGSNDEYAMPGDCGGGEDPNWDGGLKRNQGRRGDRTQQAASTIGV
jgi:RHS repeat-associated protein